MQRPLHIDLLRDHDQTMLKISIGEQTRLLNAAEAEALIEKLALFRATMREAVPDQMSRTHRYHIEIDPCWYAEPHGTDGGLVLLMRHEGIGWSGFALSARQLVALGRDLREAAPTRERAALADALH
ncbi:MAG TPA: hypothetical protein VNE00_06425 [Paraburkholderia sp.]|jgi:hypothetical protein|nr:hypothetical protein [Paraburkholderia sp.]